MLGRNKLPWILLAFVTSLALRQYLLSPFSPISLLHVVAPISLCQTTFASAPVSLPGHRYHFSRKYDRTILLAQVNKALISGNISGERVEDWDVSRY
jgi:hypothetical protein